MEEELWTSILAELGKDHHRVFYEDLIADYSGEMKAIAAYLGLDFPRPHLRNRWSRKTSDGVSHAGRSGFLRKSLGG